MATNKKSSRQQRVYKMPAAGATQALRIPAERCVKFPPIKKPAIRGGLRKAGMKQDVQEKPHLDRL